MVGKGADRLPMRLFWRHFDNFVVGVRNQGLVDLVLSVFLSKLLASRKPHGASLEAFVAGREELLDLPMHAELPRRE